MSTLDKLLARSAEKCERLHADLWRLGLSNGHLLTVTAQHGEGFVLLDAATATKATEETLVDLAEASCESLTPMKFGLRGGSPLVRLRAEIPLAEQSDASEDRIHEILDGMRRASHRLHNLLSREVGAETTEPEQSCSGKLTEQLNEAGWQYHDRAGGALLVDLETGSQFLQAEIESRGAGVRFRLTLYRGDAAAQTTRQALALYLLEANAALRYARAFLRRNEDELSAGFEVCIHSARLENLPTPAEVGHALGALSVAGRQCAREIGVLMKDGSLAGAYRSTVPIFD